MINISILIPTYKRPKLLFQAIKSCIEQSHPPFEIIVGDDSPDDFSRNEIKEYTTLLNPIVKYIKNDPSRGQSDNVNMLFSEASGDKVMLLHDDDLLMPDALEILSNCFINHPSISVAYGKQFIMTDDGKVSLKRSENYNKSFYRTAKYEGSVLTSLEAGLVQQFPNNAYLIDRSLANQIKYKDVGDVCDFDFGLRVGQSNAKIFFTDSYTAKYRVSNSAISTNPKYESGLQAFLAIKNTPVPEPSIKYKIKCLKDRSGVAVGQAIANKKYKEASSIFFGRYHRSKILSLGGIKRLLKLTISGQLFSGILPTSHSQLHSEKGA